MRDPCKLEQQFEDLDLDSEYIMVRQSEKIVHLSFQNCAQLLPRRTTHPEILLRIQNKHIDALQYQLNDLVLLLINIAICLRLLQLFECLDLCLYLLFL